MAERPRSWPAPPDVKQVGGTHYSDVSSSCPHCGGAIQVWDFTAKMSFLVGSAVKYVVRFFGKNGMEDLLKAISYVEKMLNVYYPKEYADHLEKKEAEQVRKLADVTATQSSAWPEYKEGPVFGMCVHCSDVIENHFGTLRQCPMKYPATKPIEHLEHR